MRTIFATLLCTVLCAADAATVTLSLPRIDWTAQVRSIVAQDDTRRIYRHSVAREEENRQASRIGVAHAISQFQIMHGEWVAKIGENPDLVQALLAELKTPWPDRTGDQTDEWLMDNDPFMLAPKNGQGWVEIRSGTSVQSQPDVLKCAFQMGEEKLYVTTSSMWPFDPLWKYMRSQSNNQRESIRNQQKLYVNNTPRHLTIDEVARSYPSVILVPYGIRRQTTIFEITLTSKTKPKQSAKYTLHGMRIPAWNNAILDFLGDLTFDSMASDLLPDGVTVTVKETPVVSLATTTASGATQTTPQPVTSYAFPTMADAMASIAQRITLASQLRQAFAQAREANELYRNTATVYGMMAQPQGSRVVPHMVDFATVSAHASVSDCASVRQLRKVQEQRSAVTKENIAKFVSVSKGNERARTEVAKRIATLLKQAEREADAVKLIACQTDVYMPIPDDDWDVDTMQGNFDRNQAGVRRQAIARDQMDMRGLTIPKGSPQRAALDAIAAAMEAETTTAGIPPTTPQPGYPAPRELTEREKSLLGEIQSKYAPQIRDMVRAWATSDDGLAFRAGIFKDFSERLLAGSLPDMVPYHRTNRLLVKEWIAKVNAGNVDEAIYACYGASDMPGFDDLQKAYQPLNDSNATVTLPAGIGSDGTVIGSTDLRRNIPLGCTKFLDHRFQVSTNVSNGGPASRTAMIAYEDIEHGILYPANPQLAPLNMRYITGFGALPLPMSKILAAEPLALLPDAARCRWYDVTGADGQTERVKGYYDKATMTLTCQAWKGNRAVMPDKVREVEVVEPPTYTGDIPALRKLLGAAQDGVEKQGAEILALGVALVEADKVWKQAFAQRKEARTWADTWAPDGTDATLRAYAPGPVLMPDGTTVTMAAKDVATVFASGGRMVATAEKDLATAIAACWKAQGQFEKAADRYDDSMRSLVRLRTQALAANLASEIRAITVPVIALQDTMERSYDGGTAVYHAFWGDYRDTITLKKAEADVAAGMKGLLTTDRLRVPGGTRSRDYKPAKR